MNEVQNKLTTKKGSCVVGKLDFVVVTRELQQQQQRVKCKYQSCFRMVVVAVGGFKSADVKLGGETMRKPPAAAAGVGVKLN